jgi:large subunit ribosomal protein L23
MDLQKLIDYIKYPIITDKATKLLESNQYSFAVNPQASKPDIKTAIEFLFDVKVKSINTCNLPIKQRRIGKFSGTKSTYKKAIITLHSGNSINLFSES